MLVLLVQNVTFHIRKILKVKNYSSWLKLNYIVVIFLELSVDRWFSDSQLEYVY